MIRTCDGSDPHVVDSSGQPDTCGLVFDDVRRAVVHPHVFIPTQEEKTALLAAMETVLTEQYVP